MYNDLDNEKMKREDERVKNKDGSRLSRLISDSRILSFLDKLCSALHDKVKTSFSARILCSYPENKTIRTVRRTRNFRSKIAEKIEHSLFVSLFNKLLLFFMECRLKVYGAFLFAFSVSSGVYILITDLLSPRGLVPHASYNALMFCGSVLIVSLPLISSRKTLFEAVKGSKILMKILPVIGFDPEKYSVQAEKGKSLVGLLLGFVIGALSVITGPFLPIGVIAVAVYSVFVIFRPEFGVMCLVFVTPILSLFPVTVCLLLVFVSYFLKLIRGKRQGRFETVDLFVLIFTGITFFGGIVSFSPSSLTPALMRVCLILGFFLISSVKQSRGWLKKYAISLIVSATVVSIYGIIKYYVGPILAFPWVDQYTLTDASVRALSTFESPGLLGECLIMIIPIALSALISGELFRRTHVAFFAIVMCFCLVLTWCQSAWISLFFACIVLLFIWHKRATWLIFGGIVVFPVASFFVPSGVLNGFMSTVGLKSSSFRINIWRGALRMIRDNLFSGIGIGNGIWETVYPDYTLYSDAYAPHSYNLFLQISIETGIFALLVFLCIIFFSYQSGFTLFSNISSSDNVDPSGLLSADSDSSVKGLKLRKRGTDPSIILRMSSAGPLCGVFAALIHGMFDYSWVNYRVFLLFWIILGISSAFTKNCRDYIQEENVEGTNSSPEFSEIDISS